MMFDKAFKIVVGEEGGFQNDRADRGNWTGGAVGAGKLVGTKYGISAASYPKLNIANLTLDQAKDIYHQNYWQKISGDILPWGVALAVFDAAINEGVTQATRQLQATLHVECDGVLGAKTLQAVLKKDADDLLIEFMVTQLFYKISLGKLWTKYGLGWSRRLIKIVIHAVRGE